MSYEDKGFQAYNLYLSIRAHFHGGTGKNYDITKAPKQVRVSYDNYKNKASIASMFRILTERYDYDTIHNIIVSNFANGDVPTFGSRYSFCMSTVSKQVSFCLILSNLFIKDL